MIWKWLLWYCLCGGLTALALACLLQSEPDWGTKKGRLAALILGTILWPIPFVMALCLIPPGILLFLYEAVNRR